MTQAVMRQVDALQRPSTGPRKEIVRTDNAPAAVGPYSQARGIHARVRATQHRRQRASVAPQAVKSNGMLYASGSIGLVPQACLRRAAASHALLR